MDRIAVKRLRENAMIPTYGSAEAAGADLYACLEGAITIAPGETVFVPTGIAMEVPRGCAGLVFARSSLGAKRGLAPANKVGVIDCDYRGEIFVPMHNHSEEDQIIEPGERIAQMIFAHIGLHTTGVILNINKAGFTHAAFGHDSACDLNDFALVFLKLLVDVFRVSIYIVNGLLIGVTACFLQSCQLFAADAQDLRQLLFRLLIDLSGSVLLVHLYYLQSAQRRIISILFDILTQDHLPVKAQNL